MTDAQPYSVTLDLGAPPDPCYVLEVAEAVDLACKVLAYQTRHPEALLDPGDGVQLLRHLSAAAATIPQLADQIARRYEPEAGTATLPLLMTAGAARLAAEELQADFASMAEVMASLAVETEE